MRSGWENKTAWASRRAWGGGVGGTKVSLFMKFANQQGMGLVAFVIEYLSQPLEGFLTLPQFVSMGQALHMCVTGKTSGLIRNESAARPGNATVKQVTLDSYIDFLLDDRVLIYSFKVVLPFKTYLSRKQGVKRIQLIFSCKLR